MKHKTAKTTLGYIGFKIPLDAKHRFEARAKHEGRTVASLARYIIERESNLAMEPRQ